MPCPLEYIDVSQTLFGLVLVLCGGAGFEPAKPFGCQMR
jgi:hypothetical protein